MNSFLSACGLDDSLQLVVSRQGADEPRMRLLRQPFAILGRDSGADLVLDHSGVARRHVYLQVVEGWTFWVNLEGAGGRRRNGEPQTTGWLEGDQVLSLGPYTIRRARAGLGEGGSQGTPPRDNPLVSLGESRSLPETSLEFLNGPSRTTTWPMHRVMSLVGSAAGCKFRLTDPSVSRFHAALVRTKRALWVVDLLGRDGVRINGELARSSQLEDGDELRIGRYRMRVHCRVAAERGEMPSIRLTIAPRSRPPGRALSTARHADWAPAAIPFAAPTGSPARAFNPESTPTNLEIIPATPVFSLEHAPAQQDLTAGMLVPLVNQFGQMQQQMFDQFHQAMAMMVQMFGEMHRDQMEVIRSELDRLRELTDEFHSLKDELAARTRADAAREESRADSAAKAAASAPKPAIAPGVAARTAVPPTSQAPIPPIEATVSSLAAILGGAAPVEPTAAARTMSPAQPTPPAPPTNPSPASKPPAPASDRDTVAWLHQRIVNLQQERETRWQKILKLLPGVS